ncbi:MAG: Na+/H+ antiporter subunit G [Planktomarina sp.]
MTWTTIGLYVTSITLIIGAVFMLIGSIGLVKLSNSMNRLHAPTKVGTVGIGALLLASMIYSFTIDAGSLHEVLIVAFLFVTAPISANFLSKVNIHKRTCDVPPTPPTGDTWSTLNIDNQ